MIFLDVLLEVRGYLIEWNMLLVRVVIEFFFWDIEYLFILYLERNFVMFGMNNNGWCERK